MRHAKNILDMPSEYFTDDSYVETERKEPLSFIKIVFKLLIFLLFLLAMLLAYRSISRVDFNKIDLSSLQSLWSTSSTVEHQVAIKSKPIKIKSVVHVHKKVVKIDNKQIVEEIVKKVMVKIKDTKGINQIESETKSLDPAYIELMKKSLGKN